MDFRVQNYKFREKEKSRKPFVYGALRDYLPQHCLYLRPLPQVPKNLVYIVFIVLSLLSVFQGILGLVTKSIYGIYSIIVTISIS